MAKIKKKIPFEFAVELLEPLAPYTKPMFGCTAVYIEDKIMFALRDKENEVQDNGVWIATSREHHESLKKEFPNMRSIQVLGKAPTNWQILATEFDSFESDVEKICELVLERDARIGRVPKPKKKKVKKKR